MTLKTEAIVLKRMDFRETSRIVTFFTKDYGKLKGILKGIRKDHKKFGSSVDHFSLNDIIYYPSRQSDLHLVSHCDLRDGFLPIRGDIHKMLATEYVLELVDAMMPLEQGNRDIYQLMLDYLASVGTVRDFLKLICIFQIKVLLYSGFKPHLDSCLQCGGDISGQARFSLKSGGLICLRCKSKDGEVTLVFPGTVASILYIERNPWSRCLKLGLTERIKGQLLFILNNFLVFHLDRELKAMKYLNGRMTLK